MKGYVHATTSLLLAVPVGLATGLLVHDVVAGMLSAAGCASGVLLSPDLDQESITESEAVVYRNVGDLAGNLWRSYWMLYSLAIPHRHWLSHAPVIGTLGRLTYLFAPAIVVAVAKQRAALIITAAWALWPAAAGLAVSDVAHWVMDRV